MGLDLSTQTNTAKQVGGFGSIIVSGGVSYTGSAFSMQALSDSTFNTLISSKNATFGEFYDGTSQTLPAGLTIFGSFTTVDVNSGAVILYQD